MFTNIIFLIFVLLLVNLTPAESTQWLFSPTIGFLISVGLYIVVLGIIALQNRLVRKNKSKMLIVANLELLFFLICYQFVFGGGRIFDAQPFQVIPLIFALSLYFLGLIVFDISKSQKHFSDVRLIVPFALPFLLLVFFVDLLQFYPDQDFQNFLSKGTESTMGNLIFFGGTIIFMGLLMIFLPYWIQRIWNCRPLNRPDLERQLHTVCERAHFKHAGFKTWTVLNHSLTAAIIGIVPKYRYILFTQRLLDEMPPTSVEAILAHEIGHSYHKHLLIYPFIILGMSVGVGLLSFLFYPFLGEFLNWGYAHYPSQMWSVLNPVLIFAFYATTVAIYFRGVFGLFSRLFERQADLHVFALGIPPQSMIEALDYIGKITGSHHTPNWHHWGIQQRINVLKEAMQNPNVVEKHTRRVKRFVLGYFVILIVATIVLFAL